MLGMIKEMESIKRKNLVKLLDKLD